MDQLISVFRRALVSASVVGALCAATPAHADGQVICTYDPAGRSGDYYAIMQDFALEASTWSTDIEIKAYTDEETAAKDYEAGQCDGVVAVGVRLQRFNRFPTTIEAMGAIPNYTILEQLLQTLAKYESAAAHMRSGEHETVGIIPIGAVYLFVADREIDTVTELAGKRIATMDYDLASPVMVDRVGAIMVPADLGSIGPKFNNNDVDACYASAPAYGPFELWRGLESGGGILRSPLAQATLQVMVRHERFPDDFGSRSRKWFAAHFDDALAIAKKAEADIPEKYWVDIPPDRAERWDEMFLGVRLNLRDEVGAYDGKMLGVLRKLRCAQDASRAECAEQKE